MNSVFFKVFWHMSLSLFWVNTPKTLDDRWGSYTVLLSLRVSENFLVDFVENFKIYEQELFQWSLLNWIPLNILAKWSKNIKRRLCCCRIRPLELLKTCAMAGDSCLFALFKFSQQKPVFKETPLPCLWNKHLGWKLPLWLVRFFLVTVFCFTNSICWLELKQESPCQVSRKSVFTNVAATSESIQFYFKYITILNTWRL